MPDAALPGAVLFDIDGTLVDSNYLHVVAWIQAFRDVGHPVDAARIHRCIGMGSPQLLDELLGAADGDLAERAKTAHSTHYSATHHLLRPFEHTRELLAAVAARATVVMATSASSDELEALRECLRVDDLVQAFTSAADVDAAKPEPDLVEVALDRAGVPAGRAVFVGDTVWDIEAAKRAGVGCVGLLTGGISAAELRDAGALAVYEGAGALLSDLEASPLGNVFA